MTRRGWIFYFTMDEKVFWEGYRRFIVFLFHGEKVFWMTRMGWKSILGKVFFCRPYSSIMKKFFGKGYRRSWIFILLVEKVFHHEKVFFCRPYSFIMKKFFENVFFKDPQGSHSTSVGREGCPPSALWHPPQPHCPPPRGPVGP